MKPAILLNSVLFVATAAAALIALRDGPALPSPAVLDETILPRDVAVAGPSTEPPAPFIPIRVVAEPEPAPAALTPERQALPGGAADWPWTSTGQVHAAIDARIQDLDPHRRPPVEFALVLKRNRVDIRGLDDQKLWNLLDQFEDIEKRMHAEIRAAETPVEQLLDDTAALDATLDPTPDPAADLFDQRVAEILKRYSLLMDTITDGLRG